ncbi:unnamed protein product [Caenorhabditis brenneri]
MNERLNYVKNGICRIENFAECLANRRFPTESHWMIGNAEWWSRLKISRDRRKIFLETWCSSGFKRSIRTGSHDELCVFPLVLQIAHGVQFKLELIYLYGVISMASKQGMSNVIHYCDVLLAQTQEHSGFKANDRYWIHFAIEYNLKRWMVQLLKTMNSIIDFCFPSIGMSERFKYAKNGICRVEQFAEHVAAGTFPTIELGRLCGMKWYSALRITVEKPEIYPVIWCDNDDSEVEHGVQIYYKLKKRSKNDKENFEETGKEVLKFDKVSIGFSTPILEILYLKNG